MGHYAAELSCSRCGKLRCTCPPKSDPNLNRWLIDDDFEPMLGRDFDKKHAKSGNPWVLRLYKPTYLTEEAARETIPTLVAKRIEELDAQITAATAEIMKLRKLNAG